MTNVGAGWICRCVGGKTVQLQVLFCKQKTAYEMRISDWCSDVCSSDLIVRISPDLPKDFEIRRDAYYSGLSLTPDAQAFCASIREIGRASCRERVCQYV